MTVLGADLPVVMLTLLALVAVLWGWISSMRHGKTIRRMVAWLRENESEAWDALPWATRRLMPQGGIAAMRKRGLTDDPEFRALEDQAKMLERRVQVMILAGIVCLGLVIAGMAYLGWDA